jgi:glycosyltransferase involved in cell wall biosynthesis
MIRPLIIVPLDPFSEKIGGIRTFVSDFIRFAPEDFEPEVVGCTGDPVARPAGRWQSLDMDGRPVQFLPVLSTPDVNKRPMVPLSLQFTLSAVLRREAHRFDGRILQFHHPGVPVGFLTVDSPRILVVHLNVADIDSGAGESRWARLPGLLHRFEDVTLPRMDRIFLVNRDGLDFYRKRHPAVADRSAFLPTSVDQDFFRPFTPDDRLGARAALLGTLGLPPASGDRLVLFVGRIEQQKDPVLLVEAFAAAQAASGNLRLVVVGEGGMRADAEQRAAECGVAGRVHWLGYRSRAEMPSLMNGSDVLLLASRFEGMPITVLEALASGLPVVATAVGGVPLVVRDQANGRLSVDRSAEELAAGLAWVLERPREAFVGPARDAVAPYRPREVLAPFFDAHRELAARRR